MFEESKVYGKQPDPPLLTITGETYQPARIYYQIFQKNAVLGRLKRLRCIDFDKANNRWVWFYTEEAKNIKFDTSYQEIPKADRPVVLGYFTWKGDEELQLDVSSFERVFGAMLFFDQKINRRLAKVAKLKIVNKLFPANITTEEMSAHHSLFFEQSQTVNPLDEMKQIEEIASQYEDEQERQKATFAFLEKQMKQVLPEVEELRTNFYEDGIQGLEMSLQMRQIEAMEHWNGNKNFSQFDVMKTMLERLEDEDI
jgi:hypothetical protein